MDGFGFTLTEGAAEVMSGLPASDERFTAAWREDASRLCHRRCRLRDVLEHLDHQDEPERRIVEPSEAMIGSSHIRHAARSLSHHPCLLADLADQQETLSGPPGITAVRTG